MLAKRSTLTAAATLATAALLLTGCSDEGLLSKNSPSSSSTANSTQSASPAAGGYEPKLNTPDDVKQTFDALMQDPGCNNAQVMADRLKVIWDRFFGQTNRVNQPEYDWIVLQPFDRLIAQCGKPYATEVNQKIGTITPGVQERLEGKAPTIAGSPSASASPSTSK